MSNETSKPASNYNGDMVLREVFNQTDDSITVSNFVSAQVGNKITRIDTDAGNLAGAVAGDDFSYLDGATLLYTLRVLYSDTGKTALISVERVV